MCRSRSVFSSPSPLQLPTEHLCGQCPLQPSVRSQALTSSTVELSFRFSARISAKASPYPFPNDLEFPARFSLTEAVTRLLPGKSPIPFPFLGPLPEPYRARSCPTFTFAPPPGYSFFGFFLEGQVTAHCPSPFLSQIDSAPFFLFNIFQAIAYGRTVLLVRLERSPFRSA